MKQKKSLPAPVTEIVKISDCAATPNETNNTTEYYTGNSLEVVINNRNTNNTNNGPSVSPDLIEDFNRFPGLLRLYVKNGEYIYARPNDIIMIESCDHLVKVYLAYGETVKKAIRNNTLKDFLKQLPEYFIRISRFCAINIHRISGGSFSQQLLEFDFNVTLKPKHTISLNILNKIGR